MSGVAPTFKLAGTPLERDASLAFLGKGLERLEDVRAVPRAAMDSMPPLSQRLATGGELAEDEHLAVCRLQVAGAPGSVTLGLVVRAGAGSVPVIVRAFDPSRLAQWVRACAEDSSASS